MANLVGTEPRKSCSVHENSRSCSKTTPIDHSPSQCSSDHNDGCVELSDKMSDKSDQLSQISKKSSKLSKITNKSSVISKQPEQELSKVTEQIDVITDEKNEIMDEKKPETPVNFYGLIN